MIEKWLEKRIAAGIRRIILCLIAVAIMLTMRLEQTFKVTPVTEGEYHGITVHPAIVAASKVPAGVIAQIQLTMNFPATHEQAIERIGNGNDRVDSRNRRGDRVADSGLDTIRTGFEQTQVKVFDFTSRGGGWFDTDGAIVFKAWSIPLIISQLTNGDYQVLTDEEGVEFTVKSAVKVAHKIHASYCASALYNGHFGGQIEWSPWGNGLTIGGGYLDKGFVGVGWTCEY